MQSFVSSRIVRLVLAPMLSLWVAGAGCMLGCEGMAANSAASQHNEDTKNGLTIEASGDACASSNSHDCCNRGGAKAKGSDESKDAGVETSVSHGSMPGSMGTCPLAASRSTIVNKTNSTNDAVGPTVTSSHLPSYSLPEQKTSLSTPLRLPNRGHTYLRCCVFLI